MSLRREPSGSATTMFRIRKGIKPIIVEAQTFPRYHFGECLSGAGGDVLRQVGLEAEMYKRKYACKEGVKVTASAANRTFKHKTLA
jgi:hypothetical protein